MLGFLSLFWSFGYVRLSRKLRAFLEAAPGSADAVPKVRRSDVIAMLEKVGGRLGKALHVSFLCWPACSSDVMRLFPRADHQLSLARATAQRPPRNHAHLQGAVINVLGAGATMLGLSATIGVLLAKTLTSATVNPFLATSSTNWNPVLAFDVFNVQVCRLRCRRATNCVALAWQMSSVWFHVPLRWLVVACCCFIFAFIHVSPPSVHRLCTVLAQ